MSPEEQRQQKVQASEKEMRAILDRDFSASRMNTTKWREVAERLNDLSVCRRIKFVDVAEPFDNGRFYYITHDWFDSSRGPFTSLSIEWLDIDPVQEIHRGLLIDPQVINHAEEVERRLQAISVLYQWEGGWIRIVGHVRKPS